MSEGISRETARDICNIDAQIEMRRAGRRKFVHHGGALCGKCYEKPPLPGQRHCRECHNASALASYHRRQNELRRLRALEQQLSKGNQGHGQEQGKAGSEFT